MSLSFVLLGKEFERHLAPFWHEDFHIIVSIVLSDLFDWSIFTSSTHSFKNVLFSRCDRCSKIYDIYESGHQVDKDDQCIYHWGRNYTTRGNRGRNFFPSKFWSYVINVTWKNSTLYRFPKTFGWNDPFHKLQSKILGEHSQNLPWTKDHS